MCTAICLLFSMFCQTQCLVFVVLWYERTIEPVNISNFYYAVHITCAKRGKLRNSHFFLFFKNCFSFSTSEWARFFSHFCYYIQTKCHACHPHTFRGRISNLLNDSLYPIMSISFNWEKRNWEELKYWQLFKCFPLFEMKDNVIYEKSIIFLHCFFFHWRMEIFFKLYSLESLKCYVQSFYERTFRLTLQLTIHSSLFFLLNYFPIEMLPLKYFWDKMFITFKEYCVLSISLNQIPFQ